MKSWNKIAVLKNTSLKKKLIVEEPISFVPAGVQSYIYIYSERERERETKKEEEEEIYILIHNMYIYTCIHI